MKSRGSDLLRLVSQSIIHHRWVFIIGLGILSILADGVELLFKAETGINIQFVMDALIHGILVPLLIWILIRTLDHSEQKRSLDEKQLELQKTLGGQISNANNWNELVEVVIQFPRAIIPYIGAYLWVYEPESNQFLLEAGWGFTGINPPNPPSSPYEQTSADASLNTRNDKTHFNVQDFAKQTVLDDSMDLIVQCILFIHQNQPVALLYCYLPASFKVTEAHQSLIDSISPSIAMLLYETKAKDPAVLQAKAVNEERSRIAKNLHDTLAQDLAYLLHELEHFSNTKYRDLVTLVTVQDELIKMRDIADQAYTEIRDILETLESENKRNLVATLSDYSSSYYIRTGLEVSFKNKGPQQILPIVVETQIFTIFREILANINFHANARRIDIDLTWYDDHASLVVSDDGQGFYPDLAEATGHYGLKIMQHRANEIKGQLLINSTPGAGTQVQLTFPLNPVNGPVKSNSFRWLNSAIDQTSLHS